MEIKHDDYTVTYNPETATITCSGSFRLRGIAEYASITDLFNQAADTKPDTLTLDVRGLQFLNSSGINMLSKFVIQVRKHNASQMVITGSRRIPWQTKTLKNFQRLLPALQLELE
ncbi:MAG: hypothetical protein O7E52_28840 [Candidatus Poribacteria bacterium]|nr:hypothetical protein [Candidatus Poribacteria bacterium]